MPERLAEGAIDEAHALAGTAHDLGRRRILGDLGAERADAAGALQIGAAPQHGLALRKAEADRVGGVLPARLIGVEEGALDLGPEPVRHAADGRRAQESRVGAPAGQQPLQVVARHQHVAVGHDDPGVLRGAPALDQVVELGVGGERVAADEQFGVDVRILGDEAADDGHHSVVGIVAAEDQLVARIVELEAGAQRQLVKGIETAHWAEDADRRQVGGRNVREQQLCSAATCAIDGE